MCRWFAYISEKEECLLEDVLITPKHSLSKQVNEHYLPKLLAHSLDNDDRAKQEVKVRNVLFNIDGIGVAAYIPTQEVFGLVQDGKRPIVYKSAAPPGNDYNFKSLCRNIRTTCIFAHIRFATATAVTPTNNHPFVFGRHSFMHNGYVSDFLEVRRAICDLLDRDTFGNIMGTTDSEHVAALYIMHLTGGRGKASWEEEYSAHEMGVALHKTIATIIPLQKKILGNAAQPNDLNLAATDGRRLVSIRFRNHPTEQPPSLYYSTVAGPTLNRKYPDHPNAEPGNDFADKVPEEHHPHVIVSSEPITYKEEDWVLIEKNCGIKVDIDGEVQLVDSVYEASWDAQDSPEFADEV